ncbi:DUF3426 domain-containing protein [Imbroritus primus]|uniref:DUF3426 domain-containing protein n=1 Tax=Imbroritus primus TaxID=3058603 RepID=A0ACD3SP62_9BURK|nr:DUF3426 domain-containing protein [Burkholderiaceae bacterium PBA]
MAQPPRLAARCPVCHTTFRVAADQLKLRGGLVRCGKCDTVFDGRDHLLTLPTAASDTSADMPARPNADDPPATDTTAIAAGSYIDRPRGPDDAVAQPESRSNGDATTMHAGTSAADHAGTSTTPATGSADGSAVSHDLEPLADAPDDASAVPAIARLLIAKETGAASESESESVAEADIAAPDDFDAASPEATPATDQTIDSASDRTRRPMRYRPAPLGAHRWVFHTEPCALSAATPSQPLPDFVRDAEDRARAAQAPTRWLWRGLFVVLALAALAQAVYWWRGPLAAAYPALRPLLLRACAAVQCTVPPVRHLDRLAIDGTQLQKPDDTHDHYLLSLNLRSRSQAHVALPALELVLTDLDDRIIARRVLLPAEYLPPSERALLQAGLAPDGELALRVRFQSRQAAVNYRVLMFYP